MAAATSPSGRCPLAAVEEITSGGEIIGWKINNLESASSGASVGNQVQYNYLSILHKYTSIHISMHMHITNR